MATTTMAHAMEAGSGAAGAGAVVGAAGAVGAVGDVGGAGLNVNVPTATMATTAPTTATTTTTSALWNVLQKLDVLVRDLQRADEVLPPLRQLRKNYEQILHTHAMATERTKTLIRTFTTRNANLQTSLMSSSPDKLQARCKALATSIEELQERIQQSQSEQHVLEEAVQRKSDHDRHWSKLKDEVDQERREVCQLLSSILQLLRAVQPVTWDHSVSRATNRVAGSFHFDHSIRVFDLDVSNSFTSSSASTSTTSATPSSIAHEPTTSTTTSASSPHITYVPNRVALCDALWAMMDEQQQERLQHMQRLEQERQV